MLWMVYTVPVRSFAVSADFAAGWSCPLPPAGLPLPLCSLAVAVESGSPLPGPAAASSSGAVLRPAPAPPSQPPPADASPAGLPQPPDPLSLWSKGAAEQHRHLIQFVFIAKPLVCIYNISTHYCQ